MVHHNAQRLLQPVKVVNPYAEHLTFMDEKTRTRRDHRKYLGLIRAIAFLHQYQRPMRQLAGPGGSSTAYIEATPADIAAANGLAHAVLGTTLDELPPQTRLLLTLIRGFVESRSAALAIMPRDVRFTRRELREAIGWGDTQAKLHLSRLAELEYLIVRRDATRFLYELAWAGEGHDGRPFVMGLIDPETLSPHSYDAERSGLNPERSAHGRGMAGGRSPHGRTPESPNNGAVLPFIPASPITTPEGTLQDAPGAVRSYA